MVKGLLGSGKPGEVVSAEWQVAVVSPQAEGVRAVGLDPATASVRLTQLTSVLRPSKGSVTHNMAKRSPHQQRIVRDYYKNRDALMLQKLGEMIGDLYLAEGKARERLWKRVVQALENLEVPAARIEHIVQSDNPSLVADLLKTLMKRE